MATGMSGKGSVLVYRDPTALARGAAEFFAERAREAIADHGMFQVALSGGNTPRATYETLATAPYRDDIDWRRVQVFFSDERFVSPDSPESDFLMAREALLAKVPLADDAVHPIPTVDVTPGESAALYTQTIRAAFGAGSTELPHFDLILLGLGADGHTASLFPGTEALSDAESLVAANFVRKLQAWRITFTYRLIDAARCVAFLVQGEDKASVLSDVLSGADLPAARVDPVDGRLEWIIDEEAARRLPAGVPAKRM